MTYQPIHNPAPSKARAPFGKARPRLVELARSCSGSETQDAQRRAVVARLLAWGAKQGARRAA
jgi:hypothetical protein